MVPSVRQAIAVLLIVLALGLSSCGGDQNAPTELLEGFTATPTTHPLVGAIAEVSPPERIQQLKPYLDVYEPQVHIVSPRNDETLTSSTVTVDLQVRDFPIYKDADLGLGPHLHLLLDDQAYQAVYDSSAPVVFQNLAPGTHTLRVFASRPWHESFKNEGAYDQVVFNVFTSAPSNKPDESQPLLTYSRPHGSYGAEPIMLDFYLTNAPLHEVAQASDTLADWRIRCTVNGESFVFDRWQPIYLKGFQPGTNWLKLEVIDEAGNLIKNAFNPSIRLIEYTPGGDDGLSRLIRGEIPLAQAKVLVDPNYEPPTPVVEPPVTTASPPEAAPSTAPIPPVETKKGPVVAPPAAPVESDQAPTAAPAPIAEPPVVQPSTPREIEPQGPTSEAEPPHSEAAEPQPASAVPSAAKEPESSAEGLTPPSPAADAASPIAAPEPLTPSISPAPEPTPTVPHTAKPGPREAGQSRVFRGRISEPSRPDQEDQGVPEPAPAAASASSPETAAADAEMVPPVEGDQASQVPVEVTPPSPSATLPATPSAEPETPTGEDPPVPTPEETEPAIEALETAADII